MICNFSFSLLLFWGRQWGVHIPAWIITAGYSHSFFASGLVYFLFHRGAAHDQKHFHEHSDPSARPTQRWWRLSWRRKTWVCVTLKVVPMGNRWWNTGRRSAHKYMGGFNLNSKLASGNRWSLEPGEHQPPGKDRLLFHGDWDFS